MIGRRGFLTRIFSLGVVTALGPGIVEAATRLVPTVAPAMAQYRGGLTIAQIVAVSYPALLVDMRRTSDQWKESALLRELERQGYVAPVNFERRKTSIWTGQPA